MAGARVALGEIAGNTQRGPAPPKAIYHEALPGGRYRCISRDAAGRQCEHTSKRSNDITRHYLGIHEGRKAVQCPTCNKEFAQKAHLVTHMNIHRGEKPHGCGVCGMGFADSSARNRHEQARHGSGVACKEARKRERESGAAPARAVENDEDERPHKRARRMMGRAASAGEGAGVAVKVEDWWNEFGVPAPELGDMERPRMPWDLQEDGQGGYLGFKAAEYAEAAPLQVQYGGLDLTPAHPMVDQQPATQGEYWEGEEAPISEADVERWFAQAEESVRQMSEAELQMFGAAPAVAFEQQDSGNGNLDPALMEAEMVPAQMEEEGVKFRAPAPTMGHGVEDEGYQTQAEMALGLEETYEELNALLGGQQMAWEVPAGFDMGEFFDFDQFS